jgi:hypothetical protein
MHDWSFFKHGDLVEIDGDMHRVDLVMQVRDRVGGVEWVRFESLLSRRTSEFTEAALNELWRSSRLVMRSKSDAPQDFYAMAGDKLDIRTRIRLYYVQKFDSFKPGKSTAKLAQFIHEMHALADFPHHKPSPGSVRRWVNERGQPGRRLPSQMRGRYLRGPRGPREPEFAAEIFEDAFDRFLGAAR